MPHRYLLRGNNAPLSVCSSRRTAPMAIIAIGFHGGIRLFSMRTECDVVTRTT